MDELDPANTGPLASRTPRLPGAWDVLSLSGVGVVGTWVAYAALAGGDVTLARVTLVGVLTALAGVGHRVRARDIAARERLGFASVGVATFAGAALYALAALRGAPPNPVLGGPASRLLGSVALVSLACGAVAAGGLVAGRLREVHESPAERAERIVEEALENPRN
ncbi:hypothetical protein [Halomarina litorea]|uniref:hypothetical protein n=1 Tax=Halomarina litorea TaxID=2961595 RepID=UPI0020C273C7|nr:hypothetical protein [Halomarina sp. BCD28]